MIVISSKFPFYCSLNLIFVRCVRINCLNERLVRHLIAVSNPIVSCMSFPHRYCNLAVPMLDVRTRENLGPSIGFMGHGCAFLIQENRRSTKERVLYVTLKMCLRAALLIIDHLSSLVRHDTSLGETKVHR